MTKCQSTLAGRLYGFTLSALIAFAFGGPVQSQDSKFVTLEQALVDGGEPSYFAIRCAALYASMASWAGKERLGADNHSRLFDTAESLLFTAAKLRSETNGTPLESSIRMVDEDFARIAKIYVTRYKTNYANTGQAWDSDDLWSSDLAFCTALNGKK